MRYPEFENKRKKRLSLLVIINRAAVVFAGILTGFLAARFFIVPVNMPDMSMYPGITKNETILFLKTGSFDRGDIVLIGNPAGKRGVLIKRVAALEGDTVEVREGRLIINGRGSELISGGTDSRDLPAYFTRRDNMPVMKVMRDELFVVNDNPDEAYDSRWFGKITADSVAGVKVYKW